MPRCGAHLAHCIRLHIFVAEIWLSGRAWGGGMGLRRYSRAADVNNLRRNESWPTAAATAATSTRRPRQSGRNISRKSRFSTQDLFGLPNGNANKQQGQARGEGNSGSCCKLCGRFSFGFGIDFAQLAVDTFTNFESYLYMTVVPNSR